VSQTLVTLLAQVPTDGIGTMIVVNIYGAVDTTNFALSKVLPNVVVHDVVSPQPKPTNHQQK
jgi:hypothetical protein